ncbi:hypothetical protein GOODEAATRI_033775, partial [Goodea atripinnis]
TVNNTAPWAHFRTGGPVLHFTAISRLMRVSMQTLIPEPLALTVWDCRFWLASINAVSGDVSSSSSLPGAGDFSRSDIPEERQWKTGLKRPSVGDTEAELS